MGGSPTPSSKTKDPDATFGAELGSPKFDELLKLAREADATFEPHSRSSGMDDIPPDLIFTRRAAEIVAAQEGVITIDTEGKPVDE